MGLAFKLRSLIGTDRKHWPVTVRKYEIMDNGFEEKTDRGRRINDPETDEPVYEFLNEQKSTATIPRKYLKWDNQGNRMLEVVKAQTDEGAVFAPVNKELNVNADNFDELDDEEVDMDFIVELSRFINIGKKEIERHYEITKNENRAWYEQPMFLMVSGFIGLGIFLILGGIAYSKMINTETLKAIEQLQKSILPLMMWKVKKFRG